MTLRKKTGLPLAAACMVLGLMVVAQSATASHPRPKAASPYYTQLVVAFKNCPDEQPTTGSFHAPPLGPAPSCRPTATTGASRGEQSSPNLTVGNPSSVPGGPTAANMVGSINLIVCGVASGVACAPFSDPNVIIKANITDVRCKPALVATAPGKCGSGSYVGGVNCSGPPATCPASPAPPGDDLLPDYLGDVQGSTSLRITDHNNGQGPGGPFGAAGDNDSATVVQLPFPVTVPCFGPGPNPPIYGPAFGPTPSRLIGSTCSATTSANSVVPGSVVPGVQGNVEFMSSLVVNDGGTDGSVGSPGNSVYLRSGIFIP